MTKKLGRYAISELLGQSPVASVYLAADGSDEVALKVLHPQLASDETIRERFRREALEARALRHPGIVQVYDFIDFGEDRAIVMEYCPGGSLEGWKADRPEELEAFAVQAAGALDYAHGRGAVHRNIKPSNVLRGADGSFKISDFGSARLQDLVGLTATTAFLGTPQFVPPESLDRPYPDPRWDLYSLGACLYLAGTGRPHADRSMGSLFGPARERPRPRSLNPSIPAYLDGIIVSLLGPVEGRPRTAAELSSLLSERGEVRKKTKECLFCGADMPEGSSVCASCLRLEPDLSPSPDGLARAVVVTKVAEDAETLKELGRIVKTISGDPGRVVRFIIEDSRMYSMEERKRYSAVPCRLIDSLKPESAELIVELLSDRTGGKVKSKTAPMGWAARRAKKPALIAAAPRFMPSDRPSIAEERGFERSALECLGGAETPLAMAADLALAARRCLARALSLGREAYELKAGLMGIVMKAASLMRGLEETKARLDAVSLSALYASMKRLEGLIAESDDADETEEFMKEKARILEAYQGFKELERESCLLNQRLLAAASALDKLAAPRGGEPLSLDDIAPVMSVLES